MSRPALCLSFPFLPLLFASSSCSHIFCPSLYDILAPICALSLLCLYLVSIPLSIPLPCSPYRAPVPLHVRHQNYYDSVCSRILVLPSHCSLSSYPPSLLCDSFSLHILLRILYLRVGLQRWKNQRRQETRHPPPRHFCQIHLSSLHYHQFLQANTHTHI